MFPSFTLYLYSQTTGSDKKAKMCIETGDNLDYLSYRYNGRGGAAENSYEDDSQEDICVMNACSCKICFNCYTEIMFKQRKTDAEKLVEELLGFSTQVTSEETRSAEITLDIKQEGDLQAESDCESLVNHFVNLRISSPNYKMYSTSEFVTDQLHKSNAREQSVRHAVSSDDNLEAYSEYVQNGVSYRDIIRSHLIYYDFGELDEYLRNYETELRLMALSKKIRASIQSIDNEKHIYNSKFDLEFGTTMDWHSWEGFEWNQSFDFIAIKCSESEFTKNLNESSSEVYEFCKNNEYCKWANRYDSDYSNISYNSLRKKLSLKREFDKLQYSVSTTPDSSTSESSVWSDSFNFDDLHESDEQYQADVSSSFDDSETADLMCEKTQCNPRHKMKTSTEFPKGVLLFNGLSEQEKYKKKLDVIQRRRIGVVSRVGSNTSSCSDSDCSEKVAVRHRQKEQWRDKVHFEEVKVSYNVESSLSHEQLWTICYDLDIYTMPRKWKRSLRQAQRGARQQIRQYFEELKSKFGTELNISAAISNNWQTKYDFLDYDCTWLYDDQHQPDLSTSSDETLTCMSSCSDVDEHAYNTNPESIVKPRRTLFPYFEAKLNSKAKRGTQIAEYTQLKQFDSDESFEFYGRSKPIWCA